MERKQFEHEVNVDVETDLMQPVVTKWRSRNLLLNFAHCPKKLTKKKKTRLHVKLLLCWHGDCLGGIRA